jgi:hypothetical protein
LYAGSPVPFLKTFVRKNATGFFYACVPAPDGGSVFFRVDAELAFHFPLLAHRYCQDIVCIQKVLDISRIQSRDGFGFFIH